MIRRLRVKFVCITMAIVTVMMALLLVTQYRAAESSLEAASLAALRSAAREPMNPVRPGHSETPCFSLSLTAWGTLLASGSGYYDLTDEEALLQIYQAAFADGAADGVLGEYALRYVRAEGPMELRYVFTDISGEIRTLTQLRRSSALIGAAGFAGFLVLSILLAHWAVRPVERAWAQQRQFVADASHELKTPLTVILTNAELLREPDPVQAGRSVEAILAMSRQMRGLVEDLLQLARADSGGTERAFERLELSRLTEQTLLPFEPLFFEAGLTLDSRVDPGIAVTGCESQLRQVTEILLDNALKYASPGGTVTLTLTARGRECCLAVASPGQTLTPRQCRDIFRRFYRVDPARGGCGSCGLGLAIAEGIVKAHRGRIRAEGRDGVNTFIVTLPAERGEG